MPVPVETLAWVDAVCDGTVIGTHQLRGGITADVDAVQVRGRSGAMTEFVLRRWTDDAEWTHGLVQREAQMLQAVEATDVPAPRLVAADPSGADAGVRCLLMTRLPGAVELAPTDPASWIAELASMQARVHEIPVVAGLPTTSPHGVHTEWLDDAGLRRALVEAVASPTDATQRRLVHGDYQHFNILWREGAISGVVDWPSAGVGPLGADVGHCRLNLAVLFSDQAAEDYLRRYEAAAGIAVDPVADLRALLAWDPEWLEFIPEQVAGRAQLDLDGMAGRVERTIRAALARLG